MTNAVEWSILALGTGGTGDESRPKTALERQESGAEWHRLFLQWYRCWVERVTNKSHYRCT